MTRHRGPNQTEPRHPRSGPPPPSSALGLSVPLTARNKGRPNAHENAMMKHLPNSEDSEKAIAVLACTERMRAALRLVAEGTPYREAAEQAGYRDHREVYRWAKKAGLVEVHTKQLVASCKRIVALSNAELERRLIEAPEEISSKDLAVISGISADKAARYEGWGKQGDRDEAGITSPFLDRLEAAVRAGKTVKLEVSPRPVDADAIDVKPVRRE